MNRLTFLLLFAILITGSSTYGQKRVEMSVDAQGILGVLINDDQFFNIEIKTGKTDKIAIISVINGENFESAHITSEVVNGILQLNASRVPYFKDADDKLAAHKVLSITLTLLLPEDLELWIDSSLAAVQATGRFSLINLNLGRGDCILSAFRGSGTINTLSGAINVETKDCQIKAESRHGTKKVTTKPFGTAYLHLQSLSGNITVTQNQ